MIVTIIAALVALVIGGAAGYFIFRYVIKGKYNEMIEAANKEAEVVKEKKLLEVKEKFLNKKAELEKEVQQRNSRIQQIENKLKHREISLNQRQEDLGRRKMEIDQYQHDGQNHRNPLFFIWRLHQMSLHINFTLRLHFYKFRSFFEFICNIFIIIPK